MQNSDIKRFPRFAIIASYENMAIDFQEGNCNLLENNTEEHTIQISVEKYFTLLRGTKARGMTML